VPVSFLTDEQRQRYGRYAGDPTPDQLARYFHLDDSDRDLIRRRRYDHVPLGFAVQLGTVRFLGTFLADPTAVPPVVVKTMAVQVTVADPRCLERYRTGETRWDHMAEIRRHYGYREFSEPSVHFRLARWLHALCWTGTERPSVLFDRATAWLVAHKVLLPGVSMLERLVARIRARANQRLWRRLSAPVTPAQQKQLDRLLDVVEGERQTPFDRLRQGPVLQSGPELVRAVSRLEEVRQYAVGLPGWDRLPRSKVRALARQAGAAKAQAVARMPQTRRTATLVAFVRSLEASAQDDILDLFDLLVARLFAEAKAARQKARLRSLRDLDAAALLLRDACCFLLEDAVPDAEVRAAVFAAVPRAQLADAMVEVETLAVPENHSIKELRERHRRLRRFLPVMLDAIHFGATPAGQPVLDAILHLRATGHRRPLAASAPVDFVPASWRREVRRDDGGIDAKAYALCLADRLRHGLRRRDLFASPSLRYADPRQGLLAGTAWEAARPTVCRTLGVVATAGEELDRLAERLDARYRATAANLPTNAAVRLEADGTDLDLTVSPLDKLDEPASLKALRAAVAIRLPRVDLPEILLEIDARTGFASDFSHASEGGARVEDLSTSVCAVLVAEACNTGLEPLIRPDHPALRRGRLGWVRQNYLRAETLTRANARLVTAQNGLDLARRWGGGDVASADGLRFVVPVRTIHAGPNPKYFGPERGVTSYNLVSDQFTGLNAITVPGTLRDSLVLLSVVLEQATDLRPTEIMTDAGASTDTIFGIFWLLGYQFSPRLAAIGDARFWRMDGRADYGALDALAAHTINRPLIERHWDDLLRLAGSLTLGLVPATGLIRTLQTNDRPTKLAQALAELGRIIKTQYLLAYIDDEAYRRRILIQLNRGEQRHQLARAVFHGRRGELRQRYREGQEDQLGALGLVVNMIVLWNTIDMDAALQQLRAEGFPVRDEDIARLTPLGHDHINRLGRYAFTLPEPVARGELRPLRTVGELEDSLA
jgi:TnpA family transposase